MTAAALNNRHTASLVCLWEKYFERNTVRAGGRYLGNDMDCHLLQQGPVSAPVSIFWRFAVASVTMLAILLATVVCVRWAARSSVLCRAGLLRILFQLLVLLYRRRAHQHRS